MTTLKAEKRSMDVKAKRLRREGYVTGNLFGRKIEGSIPLKMTRKDIDALMKTEGKGGQINLEVEGETYDVLIKEVNYNSIAGRFDEIDFQALDSNQEVHSVAELIFVNHDKIQEGVFQELITEISYRALPADLVEKITIDVGDMKVGDKIFVGDLDIAKNDKVTLKTSKEAAVAEVTAVRNAAPADDEEEEAAAEE